MINSALTQKLIRNPQPVETRLIASLQLQQHNVETRYASSLQNTVMTHHVAGAALPVETHSRASLQQQSDRVKTDRVIAYAGIARNAPTQFAGAGLPRNPPRF